MKKDGDLRESIAHSSSLWDLEIAYHRLHADR